MNTKECSACITARQIHPLIGDKPNEYCFHHQDPNTKPNTKWIDNHPACKCGHNIPQHDQSSECLNCDCQFFALITPDPTENWSNHLDRGKGFTHHSEDDCDEEYLRTKGEKCKYCEWAISVDGKLCNTHFKNPQDKNYTPDNISIQKTGKSIQDSLEEQIQNGLAIYLMDRHHIGDLEADAYAIANFKALVASAVLEGRVEELESFMSFSAGKPSDSVVPLSELLERLSSHIRHIKEKTGK